MRTALGLFSTLPVRPLADLDRRSSERAIAAFPAAGALVGTLAAAPLALGAWAGVPLVGAVLGLALLAALTGALHLDGLADTADGLGSRKPPADALSIMRRSDIGPMGVVAVVFILVLDVTALASMGPGFLAAPLALLVAAVLGRLGVVFAARAPAARPDGFGAHFCALRNARSLTANAMASLVLAVGAGWLISGWSSAVGFGVAAAFAVALGQCWQRHLTRRLGGMTGDTFGSVVEVVQATFLVLACLWLRLGLT